MSYRNKLKQRLSFASIGALLLASFLGLDIASATIPYTNSLASLDGTGNQGNDHSSRVGNFSGDGRFVVFASNASNLVPGDTNGVQDIFVKDLQTNNVVRANVSTSGAQTTVSTGAAKLSLNGRYVAFSTWDTNMVSGDNSYSSVFVRDLVSNTTEMISVSTSGGPNNGHAPEDFDISADGRYVVFSSDATNLVTGDTNGFKDIFVRDRVLGTTTLVSKNSSGNLGSSESGDVAIDCTGSTIAFISYASNLVNSDTNSQPDVFIVKRVGQDAITNITINANASNAPGGGLDLSCDGSSVVFRSWATNLTTPATAGGVLHLFVHNIFSGDVELVSQSSGGIEGNLQSSSPSISGEGKYVVFISGANNLVAGDTNGKSDVFIRDITANTTKIISMRDALNQTTISSSTPSINNSGEYVAFSSGDTGLVLSDTNNKADVFVSETGLAACVL